MQTQKTISLRQVALSPQEFLRAGPKPVDQEYGWAGTFWDREMIEDSHPVYRASSPQPTAEAFAKALEAIAGTDLRERDYPQDFFTRDRVHGDRD